MASPKRRDKLQKLGGWDAKAAEVNLSSETQPESHDYIGAFTVASCRMEQTAEQLVQVMHHPSDPHLHSPDSEASTRASD